MDIITGAELVAYLRDPEATLTSVDLILSLANGLVGDEISTVTTPPTWVKILTLEVAERGWQKYAQESIDDWSGRRAAAVGAMALSDAERLSLQRLDGRATEATAYTIQMLSPLDTP